MRPSEPSGPDLAGVVADAEAAGLPHVVIEGFSVIVHGYVRATRDSDLLVPDGADTDAAIVRFLELSEGTRASDGETLFEEDVADMPHIRVITRHGLVDLLRGGVAPQDAVDLSELEAIHGELPIEAIPGVDS